MPTKYILLTLLFLISCSMSDNKRTAHRKVAEQTQKAQAKKEKWVCSGIQEKRVIEKLPTKDGGCKVLYTKYGKTEEKARAKANPSVCYRILEKIKNNLASIGFVCK